MSKIKYLVLFGALAAVMILAAMAEAQSGAASRASSNSLPPGPARQKAQDACAICHDARMLTQQKLDKKIWTREVDKMIRWGAPVLADDRDALIDYLAKSFPPPDSKKEMAAMLPPGPGRETIADACSDCHDYHNIVEQKLDEKEWARILEKMEDFGAYIYDDERPVILHYLVTNFPPPQRPPAAPSHHP